MHDHGRARMQCRRRLNIQSSDMEHREVRENDIVAGHIVHRDGVDRIERHRILRQHRSLRPPGRARRVDDQQRIIRPNGRIKRVLGGVRDKLFERVAHCHHTAPGVICINRPCSVCELVLAE